MTAPESATPDGPHPTGSGPSGVPHPRVPGDRAPCGRAAVRRTLKIKVVSAFDRSPVTGRQAVRRWLVQHVGGDPAPHLCTVDGPWRPGAEPYRRRPRGPRARTVVMRVAK